jgi:hypothetical protein
MTAAAPPGGFVVNTWVSEHSAFSFTVVAERRGNVGRCTVVLVADDPAAAAVTSLTTDHEELVGTRAGVCALVAAAHVCCAISRSVLYADDMSGRVLDLARNVYAALGFIPEYSAIVTTCAFAAPTADDAWRLSPERVATPTTVIAAARARFAVEVPFPFVPDSVLRRWRDLIDIPPLPEFPADPADDSSAAFPLTDLPAADASSP